ncbi:ABC transporter ATP-binding protein [Falsiroseomonas stagni]|uniref:Putative spermidine/putrescine transport system ATP-binding protein n=1 Tax=Falsiroseomonas stagni DSM 19981 TaxID=1123062 RepID=A0A1I3Y0M4_9PROT|nr:ABC transporter ATP-binding protein [Falsiroseomonas stagni]SFK25345.1 putative spermidine/putrescine transport system ATP-binding protein [Falsiroseomonas stagni DSM 19981]
MTQIDVVGLTKRYGTTLALDGVSLQAREGELVSLLGPSGCGKTTTLRCMAGFMDPDAGDILVDGTSVTRLPPQKRNFGVVFQNYALFPHLSVFDNVAYGLAVRRLPKAEQRARVADALAMVRLQGLEDRLPRALSGGQQQRVALARALVIRPRLLLLDEPLANLDARLREEVRWLIRDVQQQSRITAFYVTHDQAEAMALSDRIAVMKAGRVAQFATPREIYQRPAEAYVARFTGDANIIPARPRDRTADGGFHVPFGGVMLPVPGVDGIRPGDPAMLMLRPEALSLIDPGAEGVIPALVLGTAFLGAALACEVSLADGTRLRLQASPHAPVQPGMTVGLRVDTAHAWLMPDVLS